MIGDPDGPDGGETERLLAEAREQNLNLRDALIGAEAAAAQARRDIDEIFHRLDVRETELKRLKELLGFELDTPLEQVARSLGKPGSGDPSGSSTGSGVVRRRPRSVPGR